MRPVRCISHQTGEFGDCYRACIASILELPAEAVPNFGHLVPMPQTVESEDQTALARKWLSNRGMTIFRTIANGKWSLDKLLYEFSDWNPGVPIILHGEAEHQSAGDINHSVVMLDGRIAHDPSGAGIKGPCVDIAGERPWWWMEIIVLTEPARLAA